LFLHLGRNIRKTAVGKFLSGHKQAGKSHRFYSSPPCDSFESSPLRLGCAT
jgi:hypothetical protein